MTESARATGSDSAKERAPGSGLEPLERSLENLNLTLALERISERLSDVETAVTKQPASEPRNSMLELARLVSGSWPAFGLLFLLLFYAPLRDALNAIPDKVKSADEIGAFGVSLKSTLRIEAQRAGATALAETLPALSPSAVERLMRSSRNGWNGLNSFSLKSWESRETTEFILPDDSRLVSLAELEQHGLVEVIVDIQNQGQQRLRRQGIGELRKAIEMLRRDYPGREERSSFESTVRWILVRPGTQPEVNMGYNLTALGRTGVDVVVKTVSAQLTTAKAAEMKK